MCVYITGPQSTCMDLHNSGFTWVLKLNKIYMALITTQIRNYITIWL